jgi:hypothetical protein
MTEVRSEEIASGFEVSIIISRDDLSFSPFTLLLSSACSSCISLNAFFDFKFISNHELWSTEVVIWDQVDSGVPGANTSIAVEAIIFVVLLKAGSPLSIFKFFISVLDWVAEIFSEEWWWA